MTDKPLDCVGTTGPVGKHDFHFLSAPVVRRVGSRPEAPPTRAYTAHEHLDTIQRILEGFQRNGQMHPQYVLAALDHLKAAREKIWPARTEQPAVAETSGAAMMCGHL